MLDTLERPVRWHGRIWGPQGSTVLQQYHVGRLFPPEEKAEAWLGPDGACDVGSSYWVHTL